LSLPILISGLLALNFRLNQKIFRLVLAFSAAYLFSTTIMHLLPEAYTGYHFKWVGLFIVLGFSVQLMIENFSAGLEHGHSHHHSVACKNHFPYGIIAGLFIHSFLEGLPVYHSDASEFSHNHQHSNMQLILGLIIHNVPISFLFVALLKDHHVKTVAIIFNLLLFSIMAPAGYLFSLFLHSINASGLMEYQYIADAIVIGIFLHISTAILFETGDEHKYSPVKILSMMAGILLAFILS
jgi:zinc and cadmium transporter